MSVFGGFWGVVELRVLVGSRSCVRSRREAALLAAVRVGGMGLRWSGACMAGGGEDVGVLHEGPSV